MQDSQMQEDAQVESQLDGASEAAAGSGIDVNALFQTMGRQGEQEGRLVIDNATVDE